MGGNQSSTRSTTTNEFLNQATLSFMASHSQNVTAQSIGVNAADFSRAVITNCDVKISQNIDTSTVATGEMKTQDQADLTTSLQNAMENRIRQEADQHSGVLAASVQNSASATSDVINRTKNIISSTINSSIVQTIFATANNMNRSDFSQLVYTCSPNNPRTITLDQTIKAQVVARGVSEAIVSAMQNDSVVNSAITDLSLTARQSTSGLDDLVKALTGGFWGIIAAVVLVIIIIIALFAFGVFGGGGKSNGKNGKNS